MQLYTYSSRRGPLGCNAEADGEEGGARAPQSILTPLRVPSRPCADAFEPR